MLHLAVVPLLAIFFVLIVVCSETRADEKHFAQFLRHVYEPQGLLRLRVSVRHMPHRLAFVTLHLLIDLPQSGVSSLPVQPVCVAV